MNVRRSCYNVAVNADRFFNTWYCINEIMGDGHDAVYLDNQEAYGAGMVLDTVEECG
jgi:hypothetical protein